MKLKLNYFHDYIQDNVGQTFPETWHIETIQTEADLSSLRLPILTGQILKGRMAVYVCSRIEGKLMMNINYKKRDVFLVNIPTIKVINVMAIRPPIARGI